MEKETPRCETCGAVGMDDHNDWCEEGKRAQEETPTEEWELWEKDFDREFPMLYDIASVLPDEIGDDKGPEVREFISSLLTSHDAELRQKIEKFIDENDDGMWAGRETADAVLALFDKKNV